MDDQGYMNVNSIVKYCELCVCLSDFSNLSLISLQLRSTKFGHSCSFYCFVILMVTHPVREDGPDVDLIRTSLLDFLLHFLLVGE